MNKTFYQIYKYDKQLIKLPNNKFKIDGYQYSLDEALKEFSLANSIYSIDNIQLVLCELKEYSCKIIAISDDKNVIRLNNENN